MSSMAVHYSSKRDDWRTPRDLFDRLNAQYGPFDLDAAATRESALSSRWFGPEGAVEDAMKAHWPAQDVRRVYCNPPYGTKTGGFVKKAYDASRFGCLVVMLLPARTDTKWFHDYCLPYGEIEFLRGRLKFDGQANSAPFPSMVVVFGGKR